MCFTICLQVGITAHYVNADSIMSLAGCTDDSSTFLMLVEMQIAVQSTVFIGTASSSITETVLYERLSRGKIAHEFFDRVYNPEAAKQLADQLAQMQLAR